LASGSEQIFLSRGITFAKQHWDTPADPEKKIQNNLEKEYK
jgi:hypothetical protein